MVMPAKKESVEDTIRRVLGEERAKEKADADLQKLLKDNPVEGIRAIFRSEIDSARTRDVEAEESEPKAKDDGDEGGFFAQIIGSGR